MKITNKRAREKINELIDNGWKVYQTPLCYEVPREQFCIFFYKPEVFDNELIK